MGHTLILLILAFLGNLSAVKPDTMVSGVVGIVLLSLGLRLRKVSVDPRLQMIRIEEGRLGPMDASELLTAVRRALQYNAGMIARVLACLALAGPCAFIVGGALRAEVAGKPPYPPSDLVRRVVFDFATHRRLAPGSDNWPMTWARDGLQYTSWGDGGGFGGTNERGRVSNGFAVIRGSARDYEGRNIAGGFGADKPAPFTGKCYGILALRGGLYAWRTGDASGETAYNLQELWHSGDDGRTWSPTRVRFTARDFRNPDRGFFAPAFVQHGRDHALNRVTRTHVANP